MSEQLKVFSYGGGVQSTACLVLVAQGKLGIQTFLFANVGDDSEHPATLRYVRDGVTHAPTGRTELRVHLDTKNPAMTELVARASARICC